MGEFVVKPAWSLIFTVFKFGVTNGKRIQIQKHRKSGHVALAIGGREEAVIEAMCTVWKTFPFQNGEPLGATDWVFQGHGTSAVFVNGEI